MATFAMNNPWKGLPPWDDRVSFAVRALAVGTGGPRYRVVSRLRAGRVSEVIGRLSGKRQVWVTAEDRSELVVVV